jgi:polyisoprenoid-binding protein YceI
LLVFKKLTLCALALALAACGAPRPRQVPPPAQPAAPPAAAAHATMYRIDENLSELRILVYRAGPLARFGHNHVMVNRAIRGAVSLAADPAASTFSLRIGVAGFSVDEAQARREEGSEFAADVPDEARSGTLHNMRTPAVLDADEFPEITVDSVRISHPDNAPLSGGMVAALAIGVAGHISRVDVPFTLQIESDRLLATGTVELRQSALGLTPYSLMLGALQVQDAMTVKFTIVAVPT